MRVLVMGHPVQRPGARARTGPPRPRGHGVQSRSHRIRHPRLGRPTGRRPHRPRATPDVLGGTEWDCVHDVSAYHPEDVDIMMELFRDAVGHYVFASSTVTYQSQNRPITEDDPDDRGETQIEYGLHKLLCEDRLLAAHADWGFPATTVPFSMVLGPHNAMTDREQRMFARLQAGRPILVPGDGSTRLQVGDVDDQARALEQLMGRPATFGRRQPHRRRIRHPQRVHRPVRRSRRRRRRRPPHPRRRHGRPLDRERSIDIVQQSGALDIRSSGNAKKQDAQGPRAMLRTRFMLCINLVQHLAPNIHWWDQDTSFSIDRLQTDVGWTPEHTTASMLDRAHTWWRQRPSRHGLRLDYRGPDPGDARRITVQRHATPAPQPM